MFHTNNVCYYHYIKVIIWGENINLKKRVVISVLFILLFLPCSASALSGSFTLTNNGHVYTVIPSVSQATRYMISIQHPIGEYTGETPWITIDTPCDIRPYHYYLDDPGSYLITLIVYNSSTSQTLSSDKQIQIPYEQPMNTIQTWQVEQEETEQMPWEGIGNFWEETGIKDLWMKHPLYILLVFTGVLSISIIVLLRFPPKRRYYIVSNENRK